MSTQWMPEGTSRAMQHFSQKSCGRSRHFGTDGQHGGLRSCGVDHLYQSWQLVDLRVNVLILWMEMQSGTMFQLQSRHGQSTHGSSSAEDAAENDQHLARALAASLAGANAHAAASAGMSSAELSSMDFRRYKCRSMKSANMLIQSCAFGVFMAPSRAVKARTLSQLLASVTSNVEHLERLAFLSQPSCHMIVQICCIVRIASSMSLKTDPPAAKSP